MENTLEQIVLSSCPTCGSGVQVVDGGKLHPLKATSVYTEILWEAARMIHNGLYAREDRDNQDYLRQIVLIIDEQLANGAV